MNEWMNGVVCVLVNFSVIVAVTHSPSTLSHSHV